MARETIKQRFTLAVMCSMAAVSGLLFGYDTGVISGAILFIREQYHTTGAIESWIVASVSLGGMFGAIVGGPASDKYGRKFIVLCSSLIFIVSAIGLSLSPSPGWIIGWRFIVGLAIGVSAATAPLYISELAPYHMRGALVTLNQLFITVGILLAYLAGLLLAAFSAWRWMFAIAAIPALIQFIVMIFFPESPRWLTIKGRHEEATDILTRFRGSSEDANLEVEHLRRNMNHEVHSHWYDIFNINYRPALIAGLGLTIIQQVTGINTIIYYAPTIFQIAGFHSAKAAILATTWVGLVNVIATFIAIAFFDKLGRKPLILTGLAGMCVALFVLGFGFLMPTHYEGINFIGMISIACLIFYVACFAFSLGPGGWLINSEIYPAVVRGKGMGIATCANWIANFAVTLTFLFFIKVLGTTGTFWLYGIIGLFGIWFLYTKLPETNNKTLEEIEEFWK